MKRLILSLAILFSVFAGYAEPLGECPAEESEYVVLLPDGQYCNIYWKCYWGEAIRFQCPDGLNFNPEINVCDWPENVDCEGRPVDDGSGGSGHIHASCKVGSDGNCVHRACTVAGCDLLVNICETTSGFAICQVQ